MRSLRLIGLTALTLFACLSGVSLSADEGLEIVEVRLEQVLPGSRSHRVSVELRNPRPATASRFAFTLRNDGVEVPVYQDAVFLDEIPGESNAEVRLFNLTAPGEIELELREAWWVAVVEEDEERIQRPFEAVPGLPMHTVVARPTAGEEKP